MISSNSARRRARRTRPNLRVLLSHALLIGLGTFFLVRVGAADDKSVPNKFRLPSTQKRDTPPARLRLPQVRLSSQPNKHLTLTVPNRLPEVVNKPAKTVQIDEPIETPDVPTPRLINDQTQPRGLHHWTQAKGGQQSETLPPPKKAESEQATTNEPTTVQSVLSKEIRAPQFQTEQPVGNQQWWTPQVEESMRYSSEKIPAGIDQLIQLALQHSAQLQVYSEVPRIRATSIIEADAAFDWKQFIHSAWDDISDPVGNTLTVGPGQNRFNDHNRSRRCTGLRRKNRYGADIEVSHSNLGHQNNNSVVLYVPNNQATSRITLSFTQPLLRGRGRVYNNNLIVLAGIDTKVARDEYERQLEITSTGSGPRLLGALPGTRFVELRRPNCTNDTKKDRGISGTKKAYRCRSQTQLISCTGRTCRNAKSELVIRASAAVRNAETRIRGLLECAFGTGDTTDQVELLPVDLPTTDFIPFELYDNSVQTAVQYRSEVMQAIKQIKAPVLCPI